MSREFFNDRRKRSQAPVQYQQLAGQVARPDASPLAARQPAGKAAKAPTIGLDACRARSAAGGGLPWAVLGLAAIGLAIALGLGFVLWPSSDASIGRPTSVSVQKQTGDSPSSAQPSAADSLPIRVTEMPPELPAENWEQLLARADEHARARQWPKAATAFAALLGVHPHDHWQWFRAATVLAWVEDQSAYRRHCAEMLQRFGETTEPPIAERVAKSCLLAPGGIADMKPVLRLADQAVAATDHPYYAYFLMARGLAHYREGEFDKAIERASKSIAPDPAPFGLNVPAYLVVAMSHQRLGQADEARKALGQARDIMGQEWFPSIDSGELRDAWWHDWLICQVLRREAEGLIAR